MNTDEKNHENPGHEDSMDENFEQLLEQSLSRSDYFSVGDRVKGKIVFISPETIFLDINGKSEAIIPRAELADDKGNLSAKKGDYIDGFVVSTTGGEIVVTTAMGRGAVTPTHLRIAYSNGIPVSGTVIDTTKGGYVVSVSNARCFCPFSQMDIRKIAEPNEMLNKSFTFKITQFGEGGRNIVLSRRVLQEEQQERTEEELRKTLKTGMTVTGKVSSIQEFGVFLDLGGVEALIPKSELSWARNVRPSAFTRGQELSAVVKNIDWDNRRISLSVKETQQEPWERIGNYTPGTEVPGTVVNIIKVGAFVELEPGLEGLVHISNMSHTKQVKRVEDIVSIGARVSVRILAIDRDARKISLALVTDEADPWQQPAGGLLNTVHDGIVEAVKAQGINVRLANGMLCFSPRKELAKGNRDRDIQKDYVTGETIRVMITEFNAADHKCIVSEREVAKTEELQDYKKFQEGQGESSAQTNSLGSLFKNQFDKIQKNMDNK